ncbi:Exonuclease mut-7 homolog [Geodia barretti]|uniref:Exonuclease mut-7 homolog n=1 Tax=Geodia barretti TaxID=519541 RepID=A0AA35WQ75_GEOBA|nr:Exonuclease mut-7 homolog [Geodia barretti]
MSGRDGGVREEWRDEGAASLNYLQLSLPTDCVHFISDAASLRRCGNRLTQRGALIGVDAEWRLPICNGWEERMAVLQLAVNDSVYLLDMLALPHCVPHSELREFMFDVFSNPSTLKLGYSVGGDLELLARSWPFVAEVLSSAARIVDIKTLASMVDSLSSAVQAPPPEFPPHPLLSRNPPGMNRPLETSRPPHLHTPPTDTRKKPPPAKLDPRGEEREEDPLETDQHKGLSQLVHRELGRPLDKSQQISDWEKRPLSIEQLRYAALDALCLLQLYPILTARGLSIDSHFNTEPCISPHSYHSLTNRKGKKE